MTITEIKALTEVAVIEQAIIDNASDQTVVDNLNAQLAAVYAVNALTQKQGSSNLLPFSYSNRIQSGRLPASITITEIGAANPPSTKQKALGLTQYAVKVKVTGIGLNDEYPVVVTTRATPVVGQQLSATLNEYKGLSYLDFSDRLVVAATETVAQINEDTELLEAQAKRAKAKAELVNAQIGTQILQSELVIKQSLAKQATAAAAAL